MTLLIGKSVALLGGLFGMKCKRDNDARSIDHQSLELMRQKAVKAAKSGVSVRQIALTFDINVRSVYRWLANYAVGGHAALLAKEIPGRPPKISPEQLRWLVQVLIDKTPMHFKLGLGLWSLALIGELLEKELAIRLSISGLGRVVKLIGLSNPKPLKQAWRRNPELVDKWQKNIYRGLRKNAKEVGAHIYFSSETEIEASASNSKTGTIKARRYSVKMISAVSPNGHFRFMLNEGRITPDVLVEFLNRLLIGANKPVYLIVNDNCFYYSEKVARFVQDQGGMLKLFFLPPSDSLVEQSEELKKINKTQRVMLKKAVAFIPRVNLLNDPNEIFLRLFGEIRVANKLGLKVIKLRFR